MDEATEALQSDLKTLPKIITTVLISIIYARFSCSIFRPGLFRFLSLLPVLSLLPFLPFRFTTMHFRGMSGFFLSWLCVFKLVLLSFGHGRLNTTLSLIQFISLATLPVKLRNNNSISENALSLRLIFSFAIKAALLSVLFSVYRYKNELNFYALLLVYCIHMYLFLDLFLSIFAITSRVLGMELDPQFNKPYFATSLRDFWGRRWNLMVSAILRPSVYEPLKTHFGPAIGVLGAFFISGIMHEIMFYYNNLRKPTGEVTVFFMLHGICVLGEWWWIKKMKWSAPPKVIRTVITLGFVLLSSFWLFFPPLIRGKRDEKLLMESMAMIELTKNTGLRMISIVN